MSHTTPAFKIEQIKESNSYKDLTYKGLERIIERKLYLVGTCTNLVQSLHYYLFKPSTISIFNSYYQITHSTFKSYLLIMRDYFTERSIEDFSLYYYYNYYNNKIINKEELVQIGYYSSKVIKENKELREWVRNDKGMDLRANSFLSPLNLLLLE